MTNREFEELLKTVSPPGRSEDYWKSFPESVARRLRSSAAPSVRPTSKRHVWQWFARTGFVGACAGLLAWLCLTPPITEQAGQVSLQTLREYYQQVAGLFPNQLEALVIESGAMRIQLSDQPNVPKSPPLLVRVCSTATQCVTTVTFSGQRVTVQGQEFEVLADGHGKIFFLASEAVLIPGKEPEGSAWRVEAEWLEQRL